MSGFLVKLDGPPAEEIVADRYYVDRNGALIFTAGGVWDDELGKWVGSEFLEAFASGEWLRVKKLSEPDSEERGVVGRVHDAGTWVPLSGDRVLE